MIIGMGWRGDEVHIHILEKNNYIKIVLKDDCFKLSYLAFAPCLSDVLVNQSYIIVKVFLWEFTYFRVIEELDSGN